VVVDRLGSGARRRPPVRDARHGQGWTLAVSRQQLRAGPLLAVVNNAGSMGDGFLCDVLLDDTRLEIEVMVLAAVDLGRRASPRMRPMIDRHATPERREAGRG